MAQGMLRPLLSLPPSVPPATGFGTSGAEPQSSETRAGGGAGALGICRSKSLLQKLLRVPGLGGFGFERPWDTKRLRTLSKYK